MFSSHHTFRRNRSIYKSPFEPQRAACESEQDVAAKATVSSSRSHQEEEVAHRQRMIEQMQRELDEEGCDACMYTGIATCTGLSAYFAKMAMEQGNKHRRFHWGCSAVCVVAGAYRWYLGKDFQL